MSAVAELPVSQAREFLMEKRRNHCPFGCKTHDLDEYGYCHHLVGFTNDRRTLEPVKPLIRVDCDGNQYDTGWKTVQGGKKSVPCWPDDKFVNPETYQIVQGVESMAKMWQSDRVYRDLPKPEVMEPLVSRNPVDETLYRLQQRKRELEERLQKKQLADEVAALEEKLGEQELEELTAPKK